jgi:hypothetical protein
MERMALRRAAEGKGFIGRRWIGGLRGVLGSPGWIGGDEEQPRSQDDSVARGGERALPLGFLRCPGVRSVRCCARSAVRCSEISAGDLDGDSRTACQYTSRFVRSGSYYL